MSRPVGPASRTGLAVLLVALVSAVLAVPAWAYFSVLSSNASGAVAAGALGTPGATATATATNVTFTITAPPTGPTPSTYRVARLTPTADPSVCTVTGSSGQCSDTSPTDGTTNTYAVYAGLTGSSWESLTPRSVSVVVPSKDTTPPVTTASTSPAANDAGWNSTNVTVTLTATDASGVAATYYTTNASNPTTASTVYSVPFEVSSSATVRFFSVDLRGNAETPKSLTLSIDKTAPTGAVTAPSAGATVGGTVTVSGTAADTAGSGVASVQPQVQQGAGSFTNLGPAITTNPASWSTSWATTGLADGSYTLRALVTDVAGNAAPTATTAVTVQNTTLTVTPSTTTPTAGTAFTLTLTTGSNITGPQPITVTGLAGSPNGTAPVVPTSATFTNGVATISVTPTRAGSQTVTVKLTVDNRQGSTAVTVKPKDQGQLFFASCSGTNVSCPTNASASSFTTARNSSPTFVLARRSADEYGNSLLEASVAVTLAPSAGSLSSTSLSLGAGVSTSATITYNPPGNSSGVRTIDATGTTTGVATGAARLTITFQ